MEAKVSETLFVNLGLELDDISDKMCHVMRPLFIPRITNQYGTPDKLKLKYLEEYLTH
jgi:hypothetical protein